MEKAMSIIPNNYEFILQIINTILSWPIAAVVIVLLLRSSIIGLLGRIESVKYNNIELLLTNDINKINQQSEFIEFRKLHKNKDETLFMKRVLSIAKISPISVIPFAHYQIENAFVNDCGYVKDEYKCKIIADLSLSSYKAGKITKLEYDLFNEVTSIYNTVVNNKNKATKIKIETAIEYGQTAEKLIDKIEELSLQ
jgi:hypothetical protein